jgi:hypothetical protein
MIKTAKEILKNACDLLVGEEFHLDLGCTYGTFVAFSAEEEYQDDFC